LRGIPASLGSRSTHPRISFRPSPWRALQSRLTLMSINNAGCRLRGTCRLAWVDSLAVTGRDLIDAFGSCTVSQSAQGIPVRLSRVSTAYQWVPPLLHQSKPKILKLTGTQRSPQRSFPVELNVRAGTWCFLLLFQREYRPE
jgi:hypothetical protein